MELVLRKYDGRPHRWVKALLLGTDDAGTWLGTPAGSVVHYAYGPYRTRATKSDSVRLIPHQAWWTAMFTAPPNPTEIYCDVTTPAEHSPTRITVIDLDLDVLRHRSDGRVETEDEDEFGENAHLYAYPTSVMTAATETATALHRALTDSSPPFDGRHHKWLNHLATT